MSIKRRRVGPRMSQAVIYNGFVHSAAQVANDLSLSVGGQMQEVLGKIDGVLEEAGTDKSKLISATIWLDDMAGYAEMNAVWDAWVVQGATPARACVEAKFSSPKIRVEVAIIAAV